MISDFEGTTDGLAAVWDDVMLRGTLQYLHIYIYIYIHAHTSTNHEKGTYQVILGGLF